MTTQVQTTLLNKLLRGELSAVEAYDRVIVMMPEHAGPLSDIRNSHVSRSKLIRKRITELGGNPTEDSGAWGAFAHAIQSLASLLGDHSTLSTLEEGETQGLIDYEHALLDASIHDKTFIEQYLLPPQRHTQILVSQLRRQIVESKHA